MTEKRFTYLNTHGWNKDAFLNTMNGLDEKNKKLKKENEKLKVRINTFIEGNKTLQARLKEVSIENKNNINKILQIYYDMNKEIDTDCKLVVLDMIKCIGMEMGVDLE